MSAARSEVSFNVVKLLPVWTLLLTFNPAMSGYSSSNSAKTIDHNLSPSPVFDDFTIRQLEAIEGQTLLLPCTVRYLRDKVVSWIRSRDLHILTSGSLTFSGDKRFEAVASPTGDFWGLRIRGVHSSDAGQYECQVNTDPKMSLAFNLTVSGAPKLDGSTSKWVGQALIKGPSEVYVRDGSLATFTCEISPLSVASPQAGAHGVFMTGKPTVRWLHDNKELFEAQHPRISMRTFFAETARKVIGVLEISKVSWRDSGQYTCLQMSVKPATIRLFVGENEHSEAMQRDYPVTSLAPHHFHHIGLILLLLIFNFPT